MDDETDDIFESLVFQWDKEECVAAEAVRAFCAEIGEVESQKAN